MSFEKLKENGLGNVSVDVQFVGYTFKLNSIFNEEELKTMDQEEFELKLKTYVDSLGSPAGSITLNNL